MNATGRPHPPACSCLATAEEWYANYSPMLRGYLLGRIRDPLAADECTSETFLRAIAQGRRFRCTGDGVRPWLYTIARNIANDYEKKAWRRLETPVEFIADERDIGPTPEQSAIRMELARTLHRCIDQLPADQRDCVLLRFISGLSVGETARILGRKDGAIRALQHRAIRNLARALTVVPSPSSSPGCIKAA